MVIALLVVIGLCMGSFVNALVWRLHQTAKSSKLKAKSQKEPSILHGRSMCPNCRHQLATKDLIPVFSWLWLRGKCRYCHKPISAQYPIVELAVAGLFVGSYFLWPMALANREWLVFGLWLAILTGLTALFVYDLKWMLLPNKVVYPLFIIALGQLLVRILIAHGGWHIALDAFWGLLIGGGIFYVLFQISSGRWIGGGDVKLGALLGLTLGGPAQSFLLIFLASLIGTGVALPLLITHKASRTSRLAFGPFLIIAAVIVQLFGTSMIHWYKRTFFLL